MRFACPFLLAFLLPTSNLRADDAADARAIVARGMKAAGIPNDGKPVTMTFKYKGKTSTGDGLEATCTGDVAFQAPDLYRFTCKSEASLKIEVTRQGLIRRRPMVASGTAGISVDLLAVANGKKAWVSVLGQSQELTGEMLEEGLIQVYQLHVFSLTPLLAEKEFNLSTAGEKEVNGKKAAAVKVERDQKPAITLFFDKDTGLLAKVERKAKDDSRKEVLNEMYLDDYKDIGGRKYYTKMRVVQDGKPIMEHTLFDQKLQEVLDPKHNFEDHQVASTRVRGPDKTSETVQKLIGEEVLSGHLVHPWRNDRLGREFIRKAKSSARRKFSQLSIPDLFEVNP